MSSPHRALIVGCGRIAGGYNRSISDAKVLTHALAYHRHPSYELVACVDPDAARRSAFMKAWNVPKGFETLDAALQDSAYDIVSLCSPTGTHLAALERLLDTLVKAVFAEKPLDGKPEAARAAGAKFRERNIPVAVNFGRRFDSFIRALRDEIAAGKYGKLFSATGFYTGGVLNNGSHMIDLVIFLTGRVPQIRNVIPVREAECSADPTISALLQLDVVPFHLVGLRATGVARFELELCFERQVVVLEEGGQFMRTRPFETLSIAPEIAVAGRGTWSENDSRASFLAALDELAQWKPGIRLSSDIESACDTIAVIAALHMHAMERGS
jgi:predicted dehydrogenase